MSDKKLQFEKLNGIDDLYKKYGPHQVNDCFKQYFIRMLDNFLHTGSDYIDTCCFIHDDVMQDNHTNNVNFPNDILSDMSVKGILGKWTELIVSHVKYALYKYYVKTGNIDVGTDIKWAFEDVHVKITQLTPVLEDMVEKNIHGMGDILIGVYGVGSDEVYMFRRFMDRYSCIDEWDTDYMWNDCGGDKRLKKLLMG